MNNGKLKISVLVMTYNQERYIDEALRSVLEVQDLPDEVVISDDASTDRTVEIANRYAERFPSLLKVVVNEKNKGIYGHLDETTQRLQGDVICYLGGDDLFAPNAIKNLRETLDNSGAKANEAFVVVTNFCILKQNGATSLYNNYKLKEKSPFAMRLRQDFSHRQFGLSAEVIRRWPSFVDLYKDHPKLGYSLDLVRGLDEITKTDRFIYSDFVSTFYRVGVGVTSNSETHRIENFLCALDLIEDKFSAVLTRADRRFLTFRRAVYHAKKTGKTLDYVIALGLLMYNIRNLTPNRGLLWNGALLLNRSQPIFRSLVWLRDSVLKYRKELL